MDTDFLPGLAGEDADPACEEGKIAVYPDLWRSAAHRVWQFARKLTSTHRLRVARRQRFYSMPHLRRVDGNSGQ